jgi:phosphopantetheine--protein transferase-like protein
VAWLPSEFADAPDSASLWDTLITPQEKHRLRAFLERPEGSWPARVCHAGNERFVLPLIVGEALGGVDFASRTVAPRIRHTPLGQPRVRWNSAPSDGGNVQISFTHDGGAHVAVAACHDGLVGIGVDLVHLPRLHRIGESRESLDRFARQFMSDEEREAFLSNSAQEDVAEATVRSAAHFSLMEAASKALGTGLKIGGGMGKAGSLPKRSLNAIELQPEVRFALGPEAEARCRRLRATRLEGHWSHDAEYLTSIALLWRA